MNILFDEKDIELIAEKTAELVIAQLKEFPAPKKSTVEYISRIKTAEKLYVCTTTLDKFTKQGKISSYAFGKKIFYKLDEVEKAIEQGLRYSYNRRRM